jgi:hypothetical protein
MQSRKVSNMEHGKPMFFICSVLEYGRIIPPCLLDLTPLCLPNPFLRVPLPL